VPSVFSRIIDGELPGEFVWRDDDVVAFLSIGPVADGHTLVVPRVEVPHWLDVEPALWHHLTEVSQRIGRGIERAFDAPRVGVMVEGFEVPHVHLHLVPLDGPRAMEARNIRDDVTPEELAAHGSAIRDALAELGEAHGC
jgi:histidine triad (HIT) family protein